MEIHKRGDRGIEIMDKKEKVLIGRSTYTGETVVSFKRQSFYFLVWNSQRIVAPIKGKGNLSWEIGNYNRNQANTNKGKIIREPTQIEFFDMITFPLCVLEELRPELVAVIPDEKMWQEKMTEIFKEKSAFHSLRRLLE